MTTLTPRPFPRVATTFAMVFALVSSAWAVPGLDQGNSAEGPPAAPFIEGELLVGFAQGTGESARAAIHRRNGSRVIRHFEEIGVDQVRIPPGLQVDKASAGYALERSVRFAEPNFIRHRHGVTPNDPSFPNQWAHRNTGQTAGGVAGTVDADIDSSESGATPDAWQVSTGSTATVVAVIDTGIDIGHEDLAANIWTNLGEIPGDGIDNDGNGFIDDINGWDFANNDKSVYDPAETCNGSRNDDHGTHVAGIIGAVGNNGKGIAGVNWKTRIMPLKFLRKAGTQCGVGSDADAIAAIFYAAKMGAQFINVSWGGPGAAQALRQAFIAAGQAGIQFAAAAGNGGDDGIGDNLSVSPNYPASYDLENEIVVAASNNKDELASFSNFGGPTDLAAPGVSIFSTITGSTYASISGTSMAAPFVTGALALARSQYPGAPPSELKARILETVDKKAAFTLVTQTDGRLNLNGALRQVRPVVPTVSSPNGGETLAPGASTAITWKTNIPQGNPSTNYRIEYTSDALAGQTITTGFESGIPPEFTQPADSDAPWKTAATSARPGGSGTSSARSGEVGNNQASWMSTTRRFSAPGSVSFWYRVSSENCETSQQPVCGDYLRFFIDGVPVLGPNGRGFAGEVAWTQVTFSIPTGTHTLSWSYQKDPVCPGPEQECAGVTPEDSAWIDDVSLTGVDNVVWNQVAAGVSSSFDWAVPDTLTSAAKVRICEDKGASCQASASDESDGVFSIGKIKLTESGGSTDVTEGGASDSYTIVLLSRPNANVSITVSPDSQVTVSPGVLTFTPDNWSIAQTVMVSAVVDTVHEPTPHFGVISHSVTSSDANFHGASIRNVVANITDNGPSSETTDKVSTSSRGYWLVAADGGIFSFGDGGFFGSTGATRLNSPIVGMAATPSGSGYWFVASDGGIFSFGDAGFFGSTGATRLNQPIVGMAPTPTGKGYWLVAADGGIFSFGDAGFFGSTGATRLNQPIVGMAATQSGNGYWFVAADGGIFSFGDARFFGSTGAIKLNKPIVGMAPTATGGGYWFVATDGGIFSFGDARFFGSTGNIVLAQPIVGMASTSTGDGYWMVASDGGIFAFGDAGFFGSTGAIKLNQPIVGMAD